MRRVDTRAWAVLCLIWAAADAPALAQARDEPEGSGSPTLATRALAVVGPDARPLRPLVGVVVAGSGPAAGAAVEFTVGRRKRWGVGGEGLISARNYQHALVRVGDVGRRRHLPELHPADSPVTAIMSAGRRQTGAAVYLEHRYRRLPRLSLYGVEGGEVAALRTDFGVRRTTTDLVAQWSRAPGVGVAARVGLLTTASFAGTDRAHPDARERFGVALDDAGVARTRFVTTAVGVVVDRRSEQNGSRAGWMLQTAATRFASMSGAAPSFARVSFEARGQRPVGWNAHLLAARAVVSADVAASGEHVPFYLQQTLGGATTLRAFDSYRVRGERIAHVTLESRWRVLPLLEVAPFVDAGRALSGHLDSGLSGWLIAPGLGARLHYHQHAVGRFDVAHGRDGWRFAYAFDAPF